MPAPYSYNRYVSTGQTEFSITFDYLSSSHIDVYLDGVEQTTGFTINTSTNKVVFDSTVGANIVVLIQRVTPKEKSTYQAQVADFTNGSVLTAEDLDQALLGLLYVSQEAEDSATSTGLGLDQNDQQWTAENKRLKNIATPTDGLDATNKDYVDGLSLYNSPTVPQVETWTATAGQTEFTFSVDPTSSDVRSFIVDVNGVVKIPTTDYTISGSTLTLISAASDGDKVTSRNIGVARDILTSIIKPSSATDVGLTIRANTGQTGDLMQFQNSTGVELVSISSSGHIEVGGETDLTNTEISSNRVEVRDYNAGTETNNGILLQVASSQGFVGIQGAEGQTETNQAFAIYDGDDLVAEILYDGNSKILGSLTMGSASAPAGHTIGSGDVLADDGVFTGYVSVGGGYANGSGTTIDTAGVIQTSGDFTTGGRMTAAQGTVTAAPSAGTDVVNKTYADGLGTWELVASLTLTDSDSLQELGSGYASYDRIRIVIENASCDGDTSTFFYIEARDSSDTRIQFEDSHEAYGNVNDIVVQGAGYVNTQAENFVANPVSGTFELHTHHSSSRPCAMEYELYCDEFSSTADFVKGTLFGETTGSDIDSIAIGFGDAIGTQKGFGGGTVKVYGLKYPTS